MDFEAYNTGPFAFAGAEDAIIDCLLLRLMRIEFGQEYDLMPMLIFGRSKLLK